MIQNPHSNLVHNLRIIEQVYEATIYGTLREEVRVLNILQKFGSKSAYNKLSKKEKTDILAEIEAIDNLKGSKKATIDFTPHELRKVRWVMAFNLTDIKKIPFFAREQAIISLAANFEAYISDLLREIFDKKTDCLKSNNCTLKYEELIESLKTGSTLEILKEAKIRDLTRTVNTCIDFYKKNLGFQISFSNELKELYLVRNCIVHNGRMIDKKLKEFKSERYKLGAKIVVTEEDYVCYKSTINQISEDIWNEYTKKFN